MSKVMKIVDRRPVSGRSVRALRKVLREIDSGYVTGVNIAAVRRDGTVYTFASNECPVRVLGSLKFLESDIQSEMKVSDA